MNKYDKITKIITSDEKVFYARDYVIDKILDDNKRKPMIKINYHYCDKSRIVYVNEHTLKKVEYFETLMELNDEKTNGFELSFESFSEKSLLLAIGFTYFGKIDVSKLCEQYI